MKMWAKRHSVPASANVIWFDLTWLSLVLKSGSQKAKKRLKVSTFIYRHLQGNPDQ